MQHAEKTLKPVENALLRPAAGGQCAADASIHSSPRVVAQRQPLLRPFGDALQMQVGLEYEAPAQTQSIVQLNLLQATIDRSPRILAQRRALDAAFGSAIQCKTNRLEDEEPRQARMTPVAQRVEIDDDEKLPLQGRFRSGVLSTKVLQRQAGALVDEDELPLQARVGGEVSQRTAAAKDNQALLQERFEGAAVQCADELAGSGDRSAAVPVATTALINETGMPNQLKAGIESLSGMDMSDVRVHRNSDKPAQLNALAYAQGNHIHLGSGQEQHLPHEAWHVVQQREGRVPVTRQMAGAAVNSDPALEAEADIMGARALDAGSSLSAGRSTVQSRAARPAVPTQPVLQADTGLLEPDDTGSQYVRINVPGDGSCLFYSLLYSSVAANLMPRLQSMAFRYATPAAVEQAVLVELSRVLNVEREQLRDALEGYQAQQRAVVATHWDANAATFQASLRGDVRSLIMHFVAARGLRAENLAAGAGLVPISGVHGTKNKDAKGDVSRKGDDAKTSPAVKPVLDDVPARVDSDGSNLGLGEDEDSEPGDPHEKLAIKRFLTSVRPEPKDADESTVDETVDETVRKGDGEPSLLPRGKDLPLAQEDAVEKPVFDLPALGMGPAACARIPPMFQGAIRQAINGVANGHVLQCVRDDSPLDVAIRRLVLTKIGAKLLQGNDVRFNGGEFSAVELDALLDDYKTEFRQSKVYAGEAAMSALRASHALDAQTHIFENPRSRRMGDDNHLVNVLESPGHFQAMVGPFVAGHLLPAEAIKPRELEIASRDPDEGVAFNGALNPEESFDVPDNLFDFSEVGLGSDAEKNTRIWARDMHGKKALHHWLMKRVSEDHLLRNQLTAIAMRVGILEGLPSAQRQEAEPSSLRWLADLARELANLHVREPREEQRVDLDVQLQDAQYLFIDHQCTYLPSGERLRKVLMAIGQGPLSRGKSHLGAALVHDMLESVRTAEGRWASGEHPPKAQREDLRALTGSGDQWNRKRT